MYKNANIAVVIPAFNEEQTIGEVIEKIPDYVDTIVVVDDGSSDKTAKIAKTKGAVVILHTLNKGVGAAFISGVRAVLSMDIDIMVNIDADGQFNPKDIHKLLEPIVNDNYDFVTASRFINPEYYPDMSKIKFIGNKMMSYLISKITKHKFYDVSCGFRAFNKKALLYLNLFGSFTYTQESFIDLVFKGISIKEVPMIVKGSREIGKSRVASNLFNYGFQTLKIIIRAYRDYKPFKLFGYMSLLTFIIGFALGLFLLIHYILRGVFSPHKWAGFSSGFFIILSLIFMIIGFIIDMFARMRENQEEILYELKKNSRNK